MGNLLIEEMREQQADTGGYVNDEFAMSYKALQAIQWSDSKINIFEGAVRSSKTVSANIRWYMHLCESKYNEFLITGKTEATVYRNLVAGQFGLIGIIGESNVKWRQSGKGGTQLLIRVKELHSGRMVWKTCYVVGANDQSSETKIRGITVAGWYADEITIHPENIVKQGILRCSLGGSKIFWTTNPDSPYHHIYTDYILKAEEKGYRVFHFELRDNLGLDEEYIRTIENAYTGVWYDRMIKGKWVIADGLIYSNFKHADISEGGNIINDMKQIPKIQDYFIGVDYGQANATVFLLVGYGVDGNYYVMDEYYHNGRKATANQTEKAPSDYAIDYYEFATKKNALGLRQAPRIIRSYVDPSAKGFLVECRKIIKEEKNDSIIYGAFRHANNDVDTGLQTVATLVGGGQKDLPRKLFIVASRCPETIREMSTYAWNTKSSEKTGKDVVTKEEDHCMDALRYAIYNYELYRRNKDRKESRTKAKAKARRRS